MNLRIGRSDVMAGTAAVLKGVVHGKLIELDLEPGLPDGQRVTVALPYLDFCRRIAAIGLPTMSPRPRMTASAP